MPHIAVIDLGKTNKKVVLYDETLRPVADARTSLPSEVVDGVRCEPAAAIWTWIQAQLAALHRSHRIDAIAVTTHGATWTGIDAAGALAVPVIAYEHDLGAGQAELDADYRSVVGDPLAVQAETGTPDLPLLITTAKGVRFAQRQFPTGWARVRHLLNYPQYWGFRLTGQVAAEPTYQANHTGWFDPRTKAPASTAGKLGIDLLLPGILRNPWDVLGTVTGEALAAGVPAVPVVVGIHDSNAALLPYLVKMGGRDFCLNSTGTWCVAMHRVQDTAYRDGELGQMVLFNLDAFGQPTKVSFLMGGQEYGLYHDLIGGEDPGALPAWDPTRIVLPGAFPGQFPGLAGGLVDGPARIPLADVKAGRAPAWFRDPVQGHGLLNASLAYQSEIAIRRTGTGPGTRLFIEGGFRKNTPYCRLLADRFPGAALTGFAEATSAGTALLGLAALANTTPMAFADRITIEELPIAPVADPAETAYRSAWLAAVG
jgi:L-fuculokinase